ncbi:MAG: ABC transporter substrate-binding protein [Thermoleophilaceae bacterium]
MNRRTHKRGHVVPIVAVLATAILAVGLAACGSDDGGGEATAGGKEPITIGLATAKSGLFALYDQGPNQAVKLRAEQINADGGVNGRKIKIIEGNTQSDKALATNVANELISDGANVLVITCDFDFSSPAAIAAAQAQVPAISGCGADPKLADVTTLGNFAYTAAAGTDVEGTVGAEWVVEERGWDKAFVLQDESLEYTKSVGRYFSARFEDLGGEVVGQDSFQGGDNVNVKSQVTAMAPDANGADFIYLPSWNPGAATAIRQIRSGGIDLPIVSDAAIDGPLVPQIAGNVSDVYLTSYGCFDFCAGGPDDSQYEWAEAMKEKYGEGPKLGSTIAADTIVRVVAAAVEKSGTLDGPKLVETIDDMGPIETLVGQVTFASPTCHKPVGWPQHIQEIRNGQIRFLEKRTAQHIPDVGDGNGCAGEVSAAQSDGDA